MAGAEYADFVAELHAIERAAKDDAARAASEQVAALQEALTRTAVWIDPQTPCWCDDMPDREEPHDAVCINARTALLASPAPSPAREPLDVERLRAILDEALRPYLALLRSPDDQSDKIIAGVAARLLARLSDNP